MVDIDKISLENDMIKLFFFCIANWSNMFNKMLSSQEVCINLTGSFNFWQNEIYFNLSRISEIYKMNKK